MTTLADQLLQRCSDDREQGLSASILKDLKSPQNQLTFIAVFFSDVSKGGFEQFVYNANGIYLPEVAEVLEAVSASHAVACIDQVIQLCIDDNDAYKTFLAGDFNHCAFKQKLSALTEIYREGDDLTEEAGEIIQKLMKQR
jgi:hypothetical protein